MEKIKELSIPNDVRVIIISDIHGELDLFKELLHKVNFKDEDYLILMVIFVRKEEIALAS